MEKEIAISTRLQPNLPVPHHVYRRVRLYVKEMTGGEILPYWRPPNGQQLELNEIYLVETTATAIVDWKKTSVFTTRSLVSTDNIHVFRKSD